MRPTTPADGVRWARLLRFGTGTASYSRPGSDAKRMPDDLHFRRVMGHFATGVTVVGSRGPDGEPCGLTANAVTSVSLEPPLVLVCIQRSAGSLACLLESGSFAISVLRSDQADLARVFSEEERGARFSGVSIRTEGTGSPILSDALAWLDCRVHEVHEAGDHSIVIGEVLSSGAVGGEPLVFFGGRYRSVGS